MILSIVLWFKEGDSLFFILSLIRIIIIAFLWWRDIIRESTIIGEHTKGIQNRLKLGIVLFILSEIIFFLAFFWAFFHNSLRPLVDRGIVWPPFSIISINPIRVPLFNTAILLSSGVTITWSHHSVVDNGYDGPAILITTIWLGLYFTLIQIFEYRISSFSISDSIYGRIFFVATGFHGLHVIIGSLFLIVCLVRIQLNHFSHIHHIGFELRIWYWHFVDVVWLFLFSTIYYWGISFISVK
jgi:cytochrome c oxidase subunit 3